MSKGLHIIFLSLLCHTVRPQNTSGQAALLADGYSAQQENAISFTGNPAVLTKTRFLQFAISGERLFLLSELQQFVFAAGLPVQNGHFGIQVNYTGGLLHRETGAGLAYARSFGKKMDGGLQFNYYSRQINGYGSNMAVGVEVGTMFHLTPQLHAGMQVSNPAGGKWKNTPAEKLPTGYKLGFGYDVSEKCFISLESVKTSGHPVFVNAALKYLFVPQCFVRAAIQSGTTSYSAGIGYRLHLLQVEVMVTCHSMLGITPGLFISYVSKRKQP